MPDELEEPEPRVDGTKEYRRGAIGMILFGLVLVFLTVVLFVKASQFRYIMLFQALFLIGLGIARLCEDSDG